jgi:RNase P/RNase MRP subunit p30
MQNNRVTTMKRVYADLHLCPESDRVDQITRIVEEASGLGYRQLAIATRRLAEEQMHYIRETCRNLGIDFVSRVDLRPRTPDELIRNLRKLRRRFEVVAVLCDSRSIARQAAKDRRVDLLNFPQPDFRRAFFDAAEAELASNCLASFEIDAKPLLTLEGPARIRLLSNLHRQTATATMFQVPIVLSSGVSDQLLMRRPRELAALATLFELDEAHAMEAVSANPTKIVHRNREKLSPKFVAPGIRIVKRGKNL